MQALRRYLTLGMIALVGVLLITNLLPNIVPKSDNSTSHDLTKPQKQSVASDKESHIVSVNNRSSTTNNLKSYINLTKLEENLVETAYKASFIPSNDFDFTSNSFDFSTCRLSTCFNFSRCQPGSKLGVHIVKTKLPDYYGTSDPEDSVDKATPENLQVYRLILDVIRKSKYFENDPAKACLFIPGSNTLDRDPLSASFQQGLDHLVGPHNNYGLNHLLLNFYSGSWPDYRENDFAGMHVGAAILAKASISWANYRPGFDISLPLFSSDHPGHDSDYKKQTDLGIGQRSLLASFKGKRYVFGTGSDTRNSLFHLHNDRDIIILTTCKHGKKWQEVKDKRCDSDNEKYDSHDYEHLMTNSTFCLIPRGRRLGSFRYLEALSFGCIPVVLSDNWVLPFHELIDWSNVAINIDERFLLQLPEILRSISASDIESMQRNCLSVYQKYLSSVERITMTMLSIIEARIGIIHND